MDDAVFGSECGLNYIGVFLLQSVTNYLSLGVCIHYSITSVVMESRTYDVGKKDIINL